ncbi:holo-ACP synthase [uncultured Chitinophaga sp.]|jgi:holo-[acyl-carrier-protein] synthase|uniref:holo-ACP synthase n=1 Tax=uncultured Chitinophaga sp. TaxID=339340 RepID=UPI0026337E05|nr:holo-ACP synthase [uncultured Chitinophaga sp.]
MLFSSGIDVIEIDTVKTLIDKHGERFLRRAFTEREIAYCLRKADQYRHFAGKIAAKEAVFKALKTGWNRGIQWNQIEVLNDSAGAPQLFFSGNAEAHISQAGFIKHDVSISHSRTVAAAVVIFYQD